MRDAPLLNRPPATHEIRPEKKDQTPSTLAALWRLAKGLVVPQVKPLLVGSSGFPRRVRAQAAGLAEMDEPELRREAQRVGLALRQGGFRPELVARAFALIREVSGRVLGMRHFDVQLTGGWMMLNGMIAEMETGEGKTLTATLTAATAALAGIPVHVISVNDYLTARDAELMGPVYRALGLSVGCVTQEVPPQARRLQYQADITYCTNNDVTFDYLRDKLALADRVHPVRLHADYLLGRGERLRQLSLRGLHYAIVDEADSVFIDEARTPLVISGSVGAEQVRRFYEEALELAGKLKDGEDYQLDRLRSQVRLSERGRLRLEGMVAGLDPLWEGRLRREEMVTKALSALTMFFRDEHYVVRDDKVQIVDEFTGRIMADRSWEQGLHQLIEVKEGCPLTERRDTLARISYQRFFRRYLQLAGMTGTAREIRGELWTTYGLSTVKVPTNRPCRRRRLASLILPTMAEKWQVVAEEAARFHRQGRPVLVGTRSVSASEAAGQALARAGLPHRILNAKQDKEEAEIIAQAGEAGRITVATNMAGRGTDIKLAPGVAEKGGLHVIITEMHEAGRIDRQLAGRAARQGDPGSYQFILSLEDQLLENSAGVLKNGVGKLCLSHGGVGTLAGMQLFRSAQRRMERLHARVRRQLIKQDGRQGEMLSFSGRYE